MLDEEICIRYQNGEIDICKELFQNCKSWLRSIAAYYAGRYPRIMYDTDDYMQEGFVAALRAAEHFNPDLGVKYKTYASTAVRNSIYTIIRKEYGNLFGVELPENDDQVEQPWEQEIEEYEITPLPDIYRLSPEQVFIKREWYGNIHLAIRRLTPRENVWLRFRYGFDNNPHSLAESARTFQLSENRGNTLEKMALAHFRSELFKHEIEEYPISA